ncbi:restriction endonuclease [Oerskovia enterophila]|nr:restriction endonuclease [Oerskovia enterophila]
MADWFDYQEEVAEFFRSLGLDAKTNVTIPGVRTDHDIDVVVSGRSVAFEFRWLVECKSWKARIPKEKVLALRMIVDDTGSERGVLMAEKGYQAGALQAARSANIELTSLADLKETLSHEIGIMKVKSILPRVRSCQGRYWALDKAFRIEHDLRPDVGDPWGFRSTAVLTSVESAAQSALLNGFPVVYGRLALAIAAMADHDLGAVDDSSLLSIHGSNELFEILNSELREVEMRLDLAEQAGGTAT